MGYDYRLTCFTCKAKQRDTFARNSSHGYRVEEMTDETKAWLEAHRDHDVRVMGENVELPEGDWKLE